MFHVEQLSMSWISSAISGVGSALAGGSLPLGDWSGGWTTFSSGQSRLKDAYKRARSEAEWEALNMPSLTKQGLKDANYNPLLALTNGFVNEGAPAPSSASGGSVRLGDFRKDVLEGIKKDNDIKDATKDKIKAETDGIRADATTKQLMSRLSGFAGELMDEFATPELKKEAVNLIRRFMSSDGVDNMPRPSDGSSARGVKLLNDFAEKAAESAVEFIHRPRGEQEKWSPSIAEMNADLMGLKGKERQKYIERQRREWAGRTYKRK